MSLPISSLSGVLGSITTGSVSSVPSIGGKSGEFGSALKSAIQHVDGYQQEANQSIQQFLQGNGELHNVALATQRAEMAFDLGMQVRNKIVSAYQEIMKMQL
ncbi:MAG: flagellar hook-basal body complex protein FliE [Acidobacteriota bacterium]|nr:flagellar hook-basal body complex protein FliE [Acidobacteriota bacterium]